MAVGWSTAVVGPAYQSRSRVFESRWVLGVVSFSSLLPFPTFFYHDVERPRRQIPTNHVKVNRMESSIGLPGAKI